MSGITTVLWDIGGVLLTNGWDHNERKAVFDAFDVSQADRDEFEALHADQNDPWEKGLLTFDEYLERTLFTRPRSFTLDQVKHAMEAQSALLTDSAMPLLKELHARGKVTLGQLNNESRELNDTRLDRFGLKEYLSVFFCSGYVRLRKPDPAIYRLAHEALQKSPAEIVFVDDREKNVEEAAGIGFHAIQYQGSAALRAEFTTLGLL